MVNSARVGGGRAVKLSAGAPRRPVHEIVRVGQDETVILIILIIVVIILVALHPWLRGLSWVIGGPGFLREPSIRRHSVFFGVRFDGSQMTCGSLGAIPGLTRPLRTQL